MVLNMLRVSIAMVVLIYGFALVEAHATVKPYRVASGLSTNCKNTRIIEDMNKSESTTHIPSYLYLIVSKEVWEKSLKIGELSLPSHHRPFIHLAKEDQISKITKKFWAGADYIILKIEPEKMVGRLVYEENPGGSNKYFHLYDGTIPLNAVAEVTLVRADADQ